MAPSSSHQHPPSRALVVSVMVVCMRWKLSDCLRRLARSPFTWWPHWLYVLRAYMEEVCLTDSLDWFGRRLDGHGVSTLPVRPAPLHTTDFPSSYLNDCELLGGVKVRCSF